MVLGFSKKKEKEKYKKKKAIGVGFLNKKRFLFPRKIIILFTTKIKRPN